MAAKFLKGIDNNNQRLVNLADGTGATDAVTKQQLDAAIRGFSWKQAVRAASTGNVTIATGLNSGDTLDGVTLADGDRVLLKDQTTGSQNGIYVVGASPARALDADSSAEIDSMTVTVESGTVNADRVYTLSTDNPTLDTTALVYVQVGGGGGTYVAGNGLTESPAGTFNVGQGTGITVNADDVAINTSVVTRKYAADCAATTNPQTFTHALGTDIEVHVWEGNTKVYPDITKSATSGGQVTIDWGSAPTAAQYRVVVQG